MKRREYPEIPHTSEKDCFPLSFQQERVLYLSQLEADSTIWNKVSCKRLKGELNVQLLKKTIKRLIERHPVLRTEIKFDKSSRQVYSSKKDYFDFVNLPNMVKSESNVKALDLLEKEYQTPIDLYNDKLFKATLIKINKNEYLLIFKLHHIISDNTSFEIIWRETKKLYNSYFKNNNKNENSPQLSLDYHDYVLWQRKTFSAQSTKEQEEYWLNQFKGEIPVLDLPVDDVSPAKFSFRGAREEERVSKKIKEKLQKISMKNRVILFSTLLSAYYILLHKYSQQDDLIIGTVFSGRHYSSQIKDVVGFFVNTVGIKIEVDDNLNYTDFLKQVHEKINEAYFMQDYPFERLIEKINPDRKNNRNPLFRAMFNMLTKYKEKVKFSGIKEESWVEPAINSTQVDLVFDIVNKPDNLEVRVEYNSDIFRKKTINRIIKHYKNLLNSIITNPETKLSELDILDEEQKEQLLVEWNNTRSDYPCDLCIHELFEKQVENIPDCEAVSYKDEVLTYRKLNARSNKLARFLRDKGVTTGSVVAILVNRSLDMVIAIMAVLKAGGVYLPIDPNYPEERIEYILQNSKVNILLTHEENVDIASFNGLVFDLKDKELYLNSGENLNNISSSENLAYVIYTSGSTGKPKGVMVEHKSVNNFLYSFYNEFEKDFSEQDNCLSLTNVSFDVSVCELFIPLVFGAKLVLLDSPPYDIKNLVETITREDITFTYIPPSLLKDVYEKLKKESYSVVLNKMLVGVEPIKDNVLENYIKLNKSMKIINGYGPTEDTICATFYKYKAGKPKGKNVPIGKPISNTRIFIMDKNNKLTPPGVIGELCISGDGLARGYINNVKETEEKFVQSPFESEESMYRTGDLARWLPDGNIEFIGRKDNQVKIRGYRIESSEIEKTLLSYPSIKDAVVLVREDEFQEKHLIAYLIMDSVKDISANKVRIHLQKWLPDYMIPSAFVTIGELPLNANGKLDKEALPTPDIEMQSDNHFQKPRTRVEEKLVGIAESILNVNGIGVNDNFFELGGNSLLTIRFISEIEDTFGINLLLTDFIDLPVISEIAKNIEPLVEDAVSKSG